MKTLVLFLAAALVLVESAPNHDGMDPEDIRGVCAWIVNNITNPNIGQYLPQCDEDGNFKLLQCWGSLGVCWCVNPYTGEEIPGTKTYPGQEPAHCEAESSSSEEEDHEEEEHHEEHHEEEEEHHEEEEEEHHEGEEEHHEDEEEHHEDEEEHHEDEEEHHEQKPCCPEHWTRFDDHCYIFINSRKSWVDAESYCQFEEGHLASITCAKTNHFLQVLTKGNTHNFPESWVGGTNAVAACFWMWSDGSPFKYEDWYSEKYKNKESSCLKINSGYKLQWGTANCSQSLPFVCAKEIEHWETHY